MTASPNAMSPATSTTASTDRVDEALGTSEVSNSSAELNPSNRKKINPLAADPVAGGGGRDGSDGGAAAAGTATHQILLRSRKALHAGF